MAAQRPNPLPIYISGDASLSAAGFGGTISSSDNDADGSGAVNIYNVQAPYYFVLLRSVKIYSRGTNGAGTAYLWIDDGNLGNKECIGQISWDSTDRGLVRLAGTVVYFDVKEDDPAAERMRGRIMRTETSLYVQITDSSMSDGYRAYAEVRNMTEVPELNSID